MGAPVFILGINCNVHQSAAVLIKDGVLIAAAEEERFTRKKFDSAFPVEAIRYCLKEARIEMSDVRYAGFYWQPWKGLLKRLWWLVRYFPHSLKTFRAGGDGRGSIGTLFAHLSVPLKLWRLGFRGKFSFVDHHTAHAASAFFVSPYEQAAILTADFTGEHCSTLLGTGNGSEIRVLKRAFLPDSLGMFYAALTEFLGYRMHADEYRVMGLAAYGTPRYADIFRSMIVFKDGILTVDDTSFGYPSAAPVYSKKWIELLGEPCTDESHITEQRYADIAASGQKVLEEMWVAIAAWLKEKTGQRNLVLAGGVALNASANGVLRQSGIFEHVWVQPAANDPGCALGVCYHIWHGVLKQPRTFVLNHAYWGPAATDDEIAAAIQTEGLESEYRDDIEAATARLLADGNVVGWYQGRMEWGPRALGNRSILADSRNSAIKEIVNGKIKFRELYRPFAPSVLEEDAEKYFELAGASPFMTFVFPVKADAKHLIPAVTHVDDSARIQTVSRSINPRFWQLINEFKKITGESVILNTSFNVRDEPIVCTPEDAVRCFLNTELDYLVMGRYLCKKPR